MEYWSITLLIAIGAFGINYLFKNFNFFERNGIIHVPSIPILGATIPFILGRVSIGDVLQKVYHFRPDAKYVGYYDTTRPVVLLRDAELIKEVFIKNFDVFPGQQFLKGVNDSLVAKSLVNLEGQKWRDVRTLLSPSFTANKLKIMFMLMFDCARNCAAHLSTLPGDKSSIDVKEVFTKYANDIIATCCYGLEVDSIKDPSNKFYVYGKEVSNFTWLSNMIMLFLNTFPKLGRIIDLRLFNDYVASFFKDIVKTTIEIRDTQNISRPDMIQQMMDIRGKRAADRELDIDDITAQAFLFFLAGFDAVSSALSFSAHEIAANPEIQAKLQREIDAMLAETNGQVTYESVKGLEYLNAVVNEALRLYPTGIFVERRCVKPFELPPALPGERSFVLRKGVSVLVPIYAIHRDEKHYPEPTKFRPERFLGGEDQYDSQYYLPFGIGPKKCIGKRFALLEIKVMLFYLLATCDLKPCPKTEFPLKLSKTSLFLTAENGFWLNIQRRSDIHPAIKAQICNM